MCSGVGLRCPGTKRYASIRSAHPQYYHCLHHHEQLIRTFYHFICEFLQYLQLLPIGPRVMLQIELPLIPWMRQPVSIIIDFPPQAGLILLGN